MALLVSILAKDRKCVLVNYSIGAIAMVFFIMVISLLN